MRRNFGRVLRASVEFAHRLDLPAADVALAPTALATLGPITWAAS